MGIPEEAVNRKMLAVLGVVLILGSAGIGIWRIKAAKQVSSPSQGQSQTSAKKASDLDQAVSAANAKKDYAVATKLLESHYSASDPTTQIKLATAYANQGNYTGALAIFDKLEQAGKLTSGYEVTAAEVAARSQDTVTAIKYYQAAKVRVKAENSPTVDSQTEVIDAKIADLERQ